jgi:hypothetical protein
MLTDAEVTEIRRGDRQRLYIYGTIIFDDIFGIERRVNFCQFGLWNMGGNFSTINTARHNDST